MSAYQYTPLDPSSHDVRLVTILPGGYNEPLLVQITHAPLIPPAPRAPAKRLSLEEIRQSLPEGWSVYETSEGRVIFYDGENDGLTSWDHPDLSFSQASYDSGLNEDDASPRLHYEALSYTWGSDENKSTVAVGDNASESVLPITQNLAEALRHLRYPEQPRTMWIDAICIDQTNIGERNVQVKRMGQIYAFATRVVAWLGPSSPNSGPAMTALDYVGKQVEITRDRFYISAPGCQEKDWCDFDKSLPYGKDVWDGIREVTTRPWFERLWIIQEIHLANEKSIIKCGRDEVPWPLFRRAALTVYGKENGVPDEVRESLSKLQNICIAAANRTFYEALYEFHDRKCADDRDKIYGLMNLAPPEINSAIPVDYAQPALEAFKQAFFAGARVENRLGQLRFAGRRDADSTPPLEGWPSWVPIWSQFISMTAHPNSGFCASGFSPATWRYNSPGHLTVDGVWFGSVDWVSEPISEDEDFLGASMMDKFAIQQRKDELYPTGEYYLDACLQVLALGHIRDRWFSVTQFPWSKDMKQALLSSPTLAITYADQERENFAIPDFFMQDNEGQHKRSRIFSIRNKNNDRYIGIIDGKVQPGDQVFVVLGCEVPMLLRPTPSGEYEVIGDCSVHGIMDGEALLGPLQSPWCIRIKTELEGLDIASYYNTDTELYSTEDPRLNGIPLPSGWQPIKWERTLADPRHCTKFRNSSTNEIINYDPRLCSEALTQRGIPVQQVTLV